MEWFISASRRLKAPLVGYIHKLQLFPIGFVGFQNGFVERELGFRPLRRSVTGSSADLAGIAYPPGNRNTPRQTASSSPSIANTQGDVR